MHDRLYQRQSELTDEDLKRHARVAGVDADRFEQELKERTHEARIREDMASAAESGANGTPSLFINGEAYTGPLEREELFEALARAAVAAKP